MTGFVNSLLQWLNAHPQLAGLVTFLISTSESIAIIGTIIPGTIMMTALGALAGAGVIPLWETIFWAILGAIVGDGISYWFGYYFQDRIRRMWPFRKYPTFLKTGEKFFFKYGSMSVFIGRFVGPVRAIVPMVAGMLGMKPLRFTIANVASAIGWAPAYLLPGILLGAVSLELPPEIAFHVILVLFLFALFILLCLWFIYKLLQLIHNQTQQMQNWIWHHLQASRIHRITNILRLDDPTSTHGQLNLAFYCLVCFLLFFSLGSYVHIAGSANIPANIAVFHLFRGLNFRTHDLTLFMLQMTLLGEKQIVLPIFAILFIWFLLWKRVRLSIHVLGLGLLSAGGIFVIKHIVRSVRPWGIYLQSSSYSFPSGHTTLATTFFLGLAFIINQSIKSANKRLLIYGLAVTIAMLVGISRLYLGAHWFTDVLGGHLLGAIILMAVIISYRRVSEKRINPIGVFFITLISFSAFYYTYYHYNRLNLLKSYHQIEQPLTEISFRDWWETQQIPRSHSSLFGFRSQAINIQWLGNLKDISQTLSRLGWRKPPNRDLVNFLHRIADIQSQHYLPLVSPQYLDKNPALILVRLSREQKSYYVIRLWDSYIRIKNQPDQLWVGVLGFIPRTYSWLYKRHPSDVIISPQLLRLNLKSKSQWDWKLILQPAKNNQLHQVILLKSHRAH